MCVCFVPVSALLRLSLDVALCLRPPFSLSLSLPLFKGPQHISILWHLFLYLLGHFCGLSKLPPQDLCYSEVSRHPALYFGCSPLPREDPKVHLHFGF